MTKYIGLDKNNGKAIADTQHLQQSIGDILTTSKGSRVMRRAYGSDLFALIDQPANEVGLLRLCAAAAHAIIIWEPRLRLSKITALPDVTGKVILTIVGKIVGLDQEITIQQGIS